MNRGVGIVMAAIALIAAAVVLVGYWMGDGNRADLVLLEVSGDIRVSSESGSEPAVSGQTLASRDRLQTGQSGRAVVGLGGDGRLDIGPQTDVQITAVDGDDVEVELFGGRVSARVMPDTRALRIARDQRAIVATDATVDVGVDDGGDLFVEVQEGRASVEGIPGASTIEAGQRLATQEGRVAEIGPLSTTLLLEVRWPEGSRVRRPTFPVSGTTRPAVTVTVDGGAVATVVEADANGEFAADVELVEGENPLVITVQDPLGDTTTSEQTIRLDSTGPGFTGEVDYRR